MNIMNNDFEFLRNIIIMQSKFLRVVLESIKIKLILYFSNIRRYSYPKPVPMSRDKRFVKNRV